MGQTNVRLTVHELAAAVAAALSAEPVEAVNGRVRAVPDVRTLRYYTTLGLLDRPAEMEGRTAYYGRRHVLQLVAIKRLQARGMPLAEVQARLLSVSDRELGKLARLPEDFDLTSFTPERRKSRESQSPLDNRPFWKARPAGAPATAAQLASKAAAPSARLAVAVPLSADVSLLLPALRSFDDDDRQAIVAAAQPLLQLLAQRRLLPGKD